MVVCTRKSSTHKICDWVKPRGDRHNGMERPRCNVGKGLREDEGNDGIRGRESANRGRKEADRNVGGRVRQEAKQGKGSKQKGEAVQEILFCTESCNQLNMAAGKPMRCGSERKKAQD